MLLGCVAQPELRATLSEGSVVSHRRDSKGDEATLRGEGEPMSVVSVSRRGPEKESEGQQRHALSSGPGSPGQKEQPLGQHQGGKGLLGERIQF